MIFLFWGIIATLIYFIGGAPWWVAFIFFLFPSLITRAWKELPKEPK